jgi:hypothetical protein
LNPQCRAVAMTDLLLLATTVAEQIQLPPLCENSNRPVVSYTPLSLPGVPGTMTAGPSGAGTAARDTAGTGTGLALAIRSGVQ